MTFTDGTHESPEFTSAEGVVITRNGIAAKQHHDDEASEKKDPSLRAPLAQSCRIMAGRHTLDDPSWIKVKGNIQICVSLE